MTETGGVAAVERALSILSVFRMGEDSLTLAELANRTGLYKSTILRLLASLENNGYIVRLASGTYRLGPTLFHLGTLYQQSFRLEDHVKPVIDRLAKDTDESSSFYIADGDRRYCIFRAESSRQVRHTVQVGQPLPMSRGVGGKVLTMFAAGANAAGAAQAGQLPFVSLGKTELDIAVIGGPVFGLNGRLVGAITVSGPTLRFTAPVIASISAKLMASLRGLTEELGGDPAWFGR